MTLQRCACSHSTLEIFIKAVAGLELRLSSPRSTRRITTPASLQQQYASQGVSRRSYSTQIADTRHDSAHRYTGLPLSATTSRTGGAAPTNKPHDSHTAEASVSYDQVPAQNKLSGGESEQSALARAERRLLKKQVRKETGTWRPDTQAKRLAAREERAARREAARKARNEASTAVETARGKQQLSSEPGYVVAAPPAVEKSERLSAKTSENLVENEEDIIVQDILKEVEQGELPKPKNSRSGADVEQQPTDMEVRKSRSDRGAASPRASQTAAASSEALDETSFTKRERPYWQTQKEALKEKLGGEAWRPRKRLSPDSLNGIRALHASDPLIYTTPVLSHHFQVTPEAIRRILKSKWQPKEDEIEDRRKRWEKRGVDRRKGIRAQEKRSRNAKDIRDILNPVRDLDAYTYD